MSSNKNTNETLIINTDCHGRIKRFDKLRIQLFALKTLGYFKFSLEKNATMPAAGILTQIASMKVVGFLTLANSNKRSVMLPTLYRQIHYIIFIIQ